MTHVQYGQFLHAKNIVCNCNWISDSIKLLQKLHIFVLLFPKFYNLPFVSVKQRYEDFLQLGSIL